MYIRVSFHEAMAVCGVFFSISKLMLRFLVEVCLFRNPKTWSARIGSRGPIFERFDCLTEEVISIIPQEYLYLANAGNMVYHEIQPFECCSVRGMILLWAVSAEGHVWARCIRARELS